jgi:hypothetical protein
MSDAVWVRGYFGEQYVLVDGHEILELRTEAEARHFLEELGEKAIEAVDPNAMPPGLRADFEASSTREDQLTVLAQMLSSGQFRIVRLQRPFRRLDPIKSVPLSSLLPPKVDEPPAKVKDTFAYEVRIVDELGEPVEGVPVSLSVSGSPRRLETDGDGRVKVDDATTGASVVTLPDLVALQDALRPRWEQPRDGQWLDEPDDHTYIDCSAPLPSVQIRAGRLHTIVVQPRVICARILQLLFDTNKSFLLPSALWGRRMVNRTLWKSGRTIAIGGTLSSQHTASSNLELHNLGLETSSPLLYTCRPTECVPKSTGTRRLTIRSGSSRRG